MSGRIEQRLREIGATLPAAGTPAGNYVPHVITGNLVYLSGQVPLENGARKFIGKVGKELSPEDGQKAARLCALNLLARLKAACDGDLDRVVRCVKLTGFVNAAPEFGDHPKVINGASDLLVQLFGEKGKHTRVAVGVSSLPLDSAVEIDLIIEIS